jgi:hypothetical protein
MISLEGTKVGGRILRATIARPPPIQWDDERTEKAAQQAGEAVPTGTSTTVAATAGSSAGGGGEASVSYEEWNGDDNIGGNHGNVEQPDQGVEQLLNNVPGPSSDNDDNVVLELERRIAFDGPSNSFSDISVSSTGTGIGGGVDPQGASSSTLGSMIIAKRRVEPTPKPAAATTTAVHTGDSSGVDPYYSVDGAVALDETGKPRSKYVEAMISPKLAKHEAPIRALPVSKKQYNSLL